MKRNWQDLPKRINAFTIRNATMRDLDTRKIIQYYSANTRISVTQKLVNENGTYYRTESAAKHGLNWAFEASAFGLPDEKAPSVPSHTPPKTLKSRSTRALPATKKQKSVHMTSASKDGERPKKSFWKKIFQR